MNYLEIRQKFREISGRFDLVDDAGADLGAGFFINEGRKYLDRLDETQKSWGSAFRLLEVGFYSVNFPYCRAIKEVWAASTMARWQLKKMPLQEMMEDYLAGAIRDTGTPTYYSPCITRYVPENATPLDLDAFAAWMDVSGGGAHNYNAILLNVPTSARLTIQIQGLFYSMELVNDADENYWSVAHPMLLIMAAMRQIEVINRNTQGVNDWEASISKDMRTLGYDLVEELIAEVDVMEG